MISDDGDFTVTFDGVPGVTDGDTREEALHNAQDALATILSDYVDRGVPLPVPPAADGRPVVEVSILVAAKLALHDAMLATGVGVNALARRLGSDEKAVRRLRDPLHSSKIEAVEAALRELGTSASVDFKRAA